MHKVFNTIKIHLLTQIKQNRRYTNNRNRKRGKLTVHLAQLAIVQPSLIAQAFPLPLAMPWKGCACAMATRARCARVVHRRCPKVDKVAPDLRDNPSPPHFPSLAPLSNSPTRTSSCWAPLQHPNRPHLPALVAEVLVEFTTAYCS